MSAWLQWLLQRFRWRRGARAVVDAAVVNRLLGLTADRALSETQAGAVASAASETLVVAGAGSGKTTLLVNRVRYLVETGQSDGSDVLMLAYNKDAAKELRERCESAGVGVRALTFHGLGNVILKAPDERTGVAFGNPGCVRSLLETAVDESLSAQARALLAKHFTYGLVPMREHQDFASLQEYSNFVRASVPTTLLGERVKSHGEWMIANHLYRMGVPYTYEALYEESDRSSDRHSPDFTLHLPEGKRLYVEYFGIDRAGKTAPGVDSEAYLRGMDWKYEVHSRNRTTLISLHYFDLKEDRLLQLLDAALRRLDVRLAERTDTEILDQANSVGYTTRFVQLVEQFLAHARSGELSHEALRRVARTSRDRAFLTVFAELRKAYEAELSRQGLPDFSALITESARRLLDTVGTLRVRHLMVDEFQDISRDRFRLIEAIRRHNPDCDVMYVGDDWQSIYEFSGSDIGIMRHVAKPQRDRVRVDMGDTYRLPPLIASASREFVLRNPAQLNKPVRSLAPDVGGGVIAVHWDTHVNQLRANLELVVARIGAAACDEHASLRVLARYREHLPTERQLKTLWAGPVHVSTVHAAKGLEADYVIVVDLVADSRGFPSTIQDDEVLRMVLPDREQYPHAEERRLFYVALTRARREVHLIAPQGLASPFAFELLDTGVGTHYGFDGDTAKACPVCDSGRLLVSARTGVEYCSNIPHCDFIAPKCSECAGPMKWSDFGTRFVCVAHARTPGTDCPSCRWGVLQRREYLNRRTKTRETFESCHAWMNTRCPGPNAKKGRR